MITKRIITVETTARKPGPAKPEKIDKRSIKMTVILSAECTGGKLSIIEQTVPVGAASPPTVRYTHDTVIYVAEGKFILLTSSHRYMGDKGTSLFIPCGIWHRIKNFGTNTGKLLLTITPGKSRNLLNGGAPAEKFFGKNTGAIKNAAKNYGVEIL